MIVYEAEMTCTGGGHAVRKWRKFFKSAIRAKAYLEKRHGDRIPWNKTETGYVFIPAKLTIAYTILRINVEK